MINLSKDGEMAEKEVWLAAWLTVAQCENTTSKDSPEKWADACLTAFRKKFPPAQDIARKALEGEFRPEAALVDYIASLIDGAPQAIPKVRKLTPFKGPSTGSRYRTDAVFREKVKTYARERARRIKQEQIAQTQSAQQVMRFA